MPVCLPGPNPTAGSSISGEENEKKKASFTISYGFTIGLFVRLFF
jgi:hypothetical protein